MRIIVLIMAITASVAATAFQHSATPSFLLPTRSARTVPFRATANDDEYPSYSSAIRRRSLMTMMAGGGGGFFSDLFGKSDGNNAANAYIGGNINSGKGPTNEVVKTVNGMRLRRLGGSDIIVSELGLGTQRWVSTDFNAPSKEDVFKFMDYAILDHGVNLIDTAEQYPIPSDGKNAKEGDSELVIGEWMKTRGLDKGEGRKKVVIASKITGGRNVTPKNIKKDCAGSLQRLRTDYIDIYQLHWPARYSPQSNWGQSLAYNLDSDKSPYWRGMGGPTSFEELCLAMQELIDEGKIRGWGLCNDNAYGLTGCTRTAMGLGVTPPCSIQGDFSLIDRKSEENGVAEAASPFNENVGFMAYNTLAGGMLTGKYMDRPAAVDNDDRAKVIEAMNNPRGRHDEFGWGRTLYRYRTDAATEAIADYNKIAKDAGVSLTELSMRWCRQRTLVTTSLVGHSNMKQLQESIKYFTKSNPLPERTMLDIDRVHMRNRLPIFSNNRVGKEWFGEGEIGETIP
eukprot:CCRYP_007270-RA/>CCRYP_007270-RA protein AED:0.09 eAED:0.09 QI:70/1/1/1/0.62/0.55/9/511/510